MKMTPLDIQQHAFKVAFRGYDRLEVTDFLESVRRDYEALTEENVDLRARLARLEDEVDDLRGREAELQECIVTARRMGEEVVAQARLAAELTAREARQEADMATREALQEAELATREARQKAELIAKEAEIASARLLQAAEEKIGGIHLEVTELRQQRARLRAELRGLLEGHLSMLEDDNLHEPYRAPSEPPPAPKGHASLPRIPNGLSSSRG